MLRALIFDFDGLILDTETPLLRSWQEVVAQHGARMDPATLIRLIADTREPEDAYRLLEARLGGPIDRSEVRRARLAREAELIAEEKAMPGLESLLKTARGAGLMTAIASSSSLSWIAPHLARLGLASSFQCICSRDDVDRVKPDPELYFAVLAGLGIGSGEAVALEDSPTGAESARRAGVVCVAVPNPATADLVWGVVDLRVPSLAAVTLDLLASLVSPHQDGGRRA